jgi:hypothetical protein
MLESEGRMIYTVRAADEVGRVEKVDKYADLKTAGLFSAAVLPMYILGAYVGGTYGLWSGAMAFVLAAGITAFVYIRRASARMNSYWTDQSAEVWTCELTDDHWSYEDSRGRKVILPWQMITIYAEDDDHWWIQDGAAGLCVYRRPLRQAGYEALFESRVRKDLKS